VAQHDDLDVLGATRPTTSRYRKRNTTVQPCVAKPLVKAQDRISGIQRAAGVKANPLAAALALPQTKRGEIAVNADLTVSGYPDAFLIGFGNRVVVVVNWAWNYLSWDRGNRVILSDPE
jgi:hypothetical protein